MIRGSVMPEILPSLRKASGCSQTRFLMFASPHLARLGPMPLWFKDERRYDLSSEYGARLWKASGVDEPAASMRRAQGASVWAYRFDWDELPNLLWVDLARAPAPGGGAIEVQRDDGLVEGRHVGARCRGVRVVIRIAVAGGEEHQAALLVDGRG